MKLRACVSHRTTHLKATSRVPAHFRRARASGSPLVLVDPPQFNREGSCPLMGRARLFVLACREDSCRLEARDGHAGRRGSTKAASKYQPISQTTDVMDLVVASFRGESFQCIERDSNEDRDDAHNAEEHHNEGVADCELTC